MTIYSTRISLGLSYPAGYTACAKNVAVQLCINHSDNAIVFYYGTLNSEAAMGSSTSKLPPQCGMEDSKIKDKMGHLNGYKHMCVDGSPFIVSHKLNRFKTENSIMASVSSAAAPQPQLERICLCSDQSQLALCLVSSTFSQMYEMRQKYDDAIERADHLNEELRERNRQVKELCSVIHELKATALDHRKQIEFQRNQIGVQQGMLREMHIGIQLMDRDGIQDHVATGMVGKWGGAPREYFILRKHCRSLVSVTKPVIGRVIRAACEVGLVSRDIGACAESCSGEDHDCTSEFYKALQFTVNQRPTALGQFLSILCDQVPSSPCQQLCKTMQIELNLV